MHVSLPTDCSHPLIPSETRGRFSWFCPVRLAPNGARARSPSSAIRANRPSTFTAIRSKTSAPGTPLLPSFPTNPTRLNRQLTPIRPRSAQKSERPEKDNRHASADPRARPQQFRERSASSARLEDSDYVVTSINTHKEVK